MPAVPKVSVLMTVYNDERFVASAIDSILAQTLADFEFIIVNDGSTDGTEEIVRGYAARDPRICVFAQANAGTTAASNYGLSLARGMYVARLDSDDVSYTHRLQTEVDFLNRNPSVALVGGGSDVIDLEGNIIGARNICTGDPNRTLMHRCIYQQSDVMFRLDVVRRLGGYRAKFRNAQDYDLWLRISEVADIAKLNQSLGQWRLNGGGYTLSRAKEQLAEVKVIKKFARQRRTAGVDGYESYAPPPSAPHRRSIGRGEYNVLVGSILLQAVRLLDARRKFHDLLRDNRTPKVLALYLVTFAPERFVRWLFGARDFYLNRLG